MFQVSKSFVFYKSFLRKPLENGHHPNKGANYEEGTGSRRCALLEKPGETISRMVGGHGPWKQWHGQPRVTLPRSRSSRTELATKTKLILYGVSLNVSRWHLPILDWMT